MNVEMLRKQNLIIYEIVVGSHAYGTATEKSDRDIRGVFRIPVKDRFVIGRVPTEVGQEKPEDIKFYELQKFIYLAADCNPNIIEFLFSPDDCIIFKSSAMQQIIDARDLFVSKKAYHTFSGYAFAQIKKAKGEHKWINNPKPKDPPNREDFCWIIPIHLSSTVDGFGTFYYLPGSSNMPFRPIPLAELPSYRKVNLRECHVAALEHVPNTYRLYHYGDVANGVFRNGNLVCESIPLEDEKNRLVGLLIYNDNEYQKAMLDWKNYWVWVKERNPERWIAQESGQVDYDCKNMQHCIRLLLSGESILQTGKPIVRFEGETLQFLRDIRAGKFKYDYLMEFVEKKMEELKVVNEKSHLPHSVDKDAISKLFQQISWGE